ncbi:MAG: hypothetical protein ACP5Q4_09495 [Candidatus Caldatribacteriaceae bacterium]
MIILQFGAGNIGRGFMGHLFHEAGYDVVFVESNGDLVSLLNERKEYPLRLLDAYRREIVNLTITGIRAFSTGEREAILSGFEEAQCVGTAVGIENYPAIAPLIAEGIRKRRKKGLGPLDCYLCENDLAAHIKLRDVVWSSLDGSDQAWAEENIGFVRVSVARMVPGRGSQAEDPLLVVADAYRQFPYDERARKAPLPRLSTMRPVYHFEAEFQRKIYIYNLGHAVLAYLGYLRGYRYVHEGFADPWILGIFDGALGETTEALFRKYPGVFAKDEHDHVLEDVHIRFGNPLLQDPIARVARDPVRKLGPADRLVGSASLCLEEGVFPEHIATACAAAFLYDWPEDPGARKLQEALKMKGIETVLEEVSGVKCQSTLGRRIIEEYHKLRMERKGLRP